MLERHRQVHAQFNKLIDGAIFAFSFWLAHVIRSNSAVDVLRWKKDIEPVELFLPYLILIFAAGPLLLELQGYYNPAAGVRRRRVVWQLTRACSVAVVGLILVMFFFKGQLARSVFILFGATSFGLLYLKEEISRFWRKTDLGQTQSKRRLVLVGAPEDTERLREDLRKRSHQGIEVVEALDLNTSSVDRLVEILHERSPNGVAISAKHTYFGQVERAIQACELEGVEVWLLADFFKTKFSQTTVDDLYGRPTLVFRSVPELSWQSLVKQVVDVGGAAVLLVFAAIPLVAVALLIRLTSPGPVLFRQQRSGLNGQPFVMLKFRSMVTNAEQLKDELAALNEMSGPVFKVTRDPRITPIGKVLRKYSIDELPQLWNVLRGEMSLVGPRPLPVDEVRRFDDLAHRRRLSVKPGLTCLWQVSGRNEVKDFRDWVRLDLEYIDNWSLWLDFKILVRTIPAVFMGSGAK